MKVKGIELMKMIADGKIKEGTKINRIDYYDIYKYVFKNGDLYFNGTSDTLRNFFKIKTILEQDFEILEDKTEEIEEIQADDNYYIHTELGSFKGRKMDIAFVNKFNELTKIVNKLNKQDTSKETNCMSD